MKEGQPQTIYLKDYKHPPFLISRTYLDFILGEDGTIVTSTLLVYRNSESKDDTKTLVLNGEDLQLNYIELDGVRLHEHQFTVAEETLQIANVPDTFELSINVKINPQLNTSLEGLYKSSGNFCTQCEAQGFRKITYFLDRPDVMSLYTVRIQADKANYPVLLSNGNPIKEGECEHGQHFAIWNDPYPKPSYLFALVAGNLVCLKGAHKTQSGKEIELRVYSEKHNADKCDHALRSLKKAMLWDEERFGLECDLEIYMIVAVDDFNMGAMENKGLNIFNSSCVLAQPETATDADFMRIEAVVAHEYFHNWTGNRVTCRDWFQLSLKEGLTVFRDQEFTSDVTSRVVKRIEDVRFLRSYQFLEDASPMAHPVRPESFIEINNFYTLTVYEKGAEIVRMYQTLFGVDGFRKGMDLYFKRHDGQAVTTDDFAAAMEDANDMDLSLFKRWYDQAGTPEVEVKGQWNQDKNTYQLTLNQNYLSDDSRLKRPVLIPIKTSLLGTSGEPLDMGSCNGEDNRQTKTLLLEKECQTFCFENINEEPIPNLLQDFSAPVKLKLDYSDSELAFLLAHSKDGFNKWDAGNRLALKILLESLSIKSFNKNPDSVGILCSALASTLKSNEINQSFLAELLILPNEKDLQEHLNLIDIHEVIKACEGLKRIVAQHLENDLISRYQVCNIKKRYAYNSQDMGRRRLKNICLQMLCELGNSDYYQLALNQFVEAKNMTEQVGAIHALLHNACEEREQVLRSFEEQWSHDSLVMDKWFAFNAISKIPTALENVKCLMEHKVFSIKNPNKVRALIGNFAGQNAYAFHQVSGEGYEFVAQQVLKLDALNPQVASRLSRTFMLWEKFTEPYKTKMYEQLQFIAKHNDLSRDVFEIVSKSLSSHK